MKVELTKQEIEWILNEILTSKESFSEFRSSDDVREQDWDEDHFDIKHSEFIVLESLYKKLKK